MQQPSDELYYQIALSFVVGIGPKTTQRLLQAFGSASAILRASDKDLATVGGLAKNRISALKQSDIWKAADEEWRYVQEQQIKVLNTAHPEYPQRLLHCSDAPQLLYTKGNATLNSSKIISIIGTRKNTDYGERLTQELIDGLAHIEGLLIVSGLAHGIDTIAHKAALRNHIPTLGVLGHGLASIYPLSNKALAREMLEQGALLTEFAAHAKVEKGNFPARNRIVAGIADACIVVESDVKGGAMITAYLAHSYNREIMAFPGRTSDRKSSGPNLLIQKNVAALITNASDLVELMAWQQAAPAQKKKASQLLLQLSEEERCIIQLLADKETTHSDELLQRSGMGSSALASCLLLLEMQGLVKTLPGKSYKLL